MFAVTEPITSSEKYLLEWQYVKNNSVIANLIMKVIIVVNMVNHEWTKQELKRNLILVIIPALKRSNYFTT